MIFENKMWSESCVECWRIALVFLVREGALELSHRAAVNVLHTNAREREQRDDLSKNSLFTRFANALYCFKLTLSNVFVHFSDQSWAVVYSKAADFCLVHTNNKISAAPI